MTWRALGRDDVGEVCCGALRAEERTSSLRTALVAVAEPDSECLADARCATDGVVKGHDIITIVQ